MQSKSGASVKCVLLLQSHFYRAKVFVGQPQRPFKIGLYGIM